ncbi:MAG: sulfotransferase [Nitrosopumilus sp.]|nr:sulfotransferase [Nitrosopumilus sp.]
MGNKISKKLTREEIFTLNSKKYEVSENTKYTISAEIKGIRGNSYCSYFVAIMIDSHDREIGRYMRWINDFNNTSLNYHLTFTTKPNTQFLIIGYRINIETPAKSTVEIELEDPSSLTIETSNAEENFDDINHFSIPKLEPLSENEELLLEKKILWLCAPPRSGTTWLGTRLLKHPSMIIWNEPWFAFHLGVLRGALTPAKDFGKMNFALEKKELPSETQKSFNVKYQFDRILDVQSSNGEYFFSPHHKNNWLPYLRKLILARTYSHAQTISKNICIKDPVSSNGIDIISECVPESKLLFLIRDGRDEVDSRMDMHRPDSWAKLRPFSNEKDRLDGISYYSTLWEVNTKNIQKGFDKHNSKLKILVKYEELKENTFDELKKIYEFLEIEISDEELNQIIDIYDFKNIPDSEKGTGKFNRTAKTGGWRDNFNEKEQNVMNSIMSKTLKQFGYPI